MKKLLLILLCLPIIGFGQDDRPSAAALEELKSRLCEKFINISIFTPSEDELSKKCECALDKLYSKYSAKEVANTYNQSKNEYFFFKEHIYPLFVECIIIDNVIFKSAEWTDEIKRHLFNVLRNLEPRANEVLDEYAHINRYIKNDSCIIQQIMLEFPTPIDYINNLWESKSVLYDLQPSPEMGKWIIDRALERCRENEYAVFMVVEQMPEFPCIKYNSYDENGEIIGYRTNEYCGEEGLREYIARNTKYPSIAKEYNITGKVYVGFIVDKDGSVTDVKILRGIDQNLDTEALRVIRSLPKYKPGKQRGEPCRVQYTIPINFTLN